jgi:hypothetical protein
MMTTKVKDQSFPLSHFLPPETHVGSMPIRGNTCTHL